MSKSLRENIYFLNNYITFREKGEVLIFFMYFIALKFKVENNKKYDREINHNEKNE